MSTQTKTNDRFVSEPDDLIFYPPLQTTAASSRVPLQGVDINALDQEEFQAFISEARKAVFGESYSTVKERGERAERILEAHAAKQAISRSDSITNQSDLSITTSAHVRPIRIGDLNDAERQAVTHLQTLDSDQVVIFRIDLDIRSLGLPKPSSWKCKRVDFTAADRVLINMRRGSDKIEILGIVPPTINAQGQHTLDFAGIPIIEKRDGSSSSLSVIGAAKNFIRKNIYWVYASRTNSSAQWVFTKEYISSNQKFDLQMLCRMPNTETALDTAWYCDVTFADEGRTIRTVNDLTIKLD